MTNAQTVRRKAGFLAAFAVSGNVSAACVEAGVSRRVVYDWKGNDPSFLEAFEEAELASTEALEEEARRRAAIGTEEPVWHNGQQVGTVRKYSDTLLIFLLKARNPSKYRERWQLQHAGADGEKLPLGAVEGFVREVLGARAESPG